MTLAHFMDWGVNWPGPFGFVWGILMFVLWAGFWILVAVVIVNLVKRGGGRRSSALDVLEERYARGEISQEEFMERKAVLRGQLPTS
jgi:putative membrane protein